MTRIRQAVCNLATMPQKHVCDFVANQTTAQRHVTIGYRLGKRDQVGLGLVSLETKHVSSSAKPADNLVRNE